MSHNHSDNPGVIAPPPIIFFGSEALGLLLNWFMPIRFFPEGLTWIVGLPLIGIGVGLGLSALRAMHRAHTPVDPYESPTAIVSDGPYRFTRNPIYLGFTLVYLGWASVFNTFWALLFLPIVLIVVDRLVILREERYLERKFGEIYSHYKIGVRRWL